MDTSVKIRVSATHRSSKVEELEISIEDIIRELKSAGIIQLLDHLAKDGSFDAKWAIKRYAGDIKKRAGYSWREPTKSKQGDKSAAEYEYTQQVSKLFRKWNNLTHEEEEIIKKIASRF